MAFSFGHRSMLDGAAVTVHPSMIFLGRLIDEEWRISSVPLFDHAATRISIPLRYEKQLYCSASPRCNWQVVCTAPMHRGRFGQPVQFIYLPDFSCILENAVHGTRVAILHASPVDGLANR